MLLFHEMQMTSDFTFFLLPWDISSQIHIKSEKVFENSNSFPCALWGNLAAILNYCTDWLNLACLTKESPGVVIALEMEMAKGKSS